MKIKKPHILLLFVFPLLLGGRYVDKPSVPSGLGYELAVDIPSVSYPLPVVEYAENNGDNGTKYTLDNPIVTLLYGFDSIWSLNDGSWQAGGANGDGPESYADEEIRNEKIWEQNVKYVVRVTNNRTAKQALAAYYDDRRDKCYSVIDGFGPLAKAYLTGSGAYTTIDYSNDSSFDVNAEMTYTAADSEYIGLGAPNSDLSGLYDIVWLLRQESPASTSGAKYFYAAPRPWRMNNDGQVVPLDKDGDGYTDLETIGGIDFERYASNVSVVPALKVCRRKAGGETGDGGGRRKDGAYPSGHTNAGYLAAIGWAYAVPERFSELLTRASELGENRIVSGMHSPLDVIGGRIQAQAIAGYAFSMNINENIKRAAYKNAEQYFGAIAEKNGQTLYEYAHTDDTGKWSNNSINKALYRQRLTYGFSRSGVKGAPPIVPQGAETLLETRQPYLTDAQRRAVLYTTEVDSGYPVLDDSIGWGRLDYVKAADGYGAFLGDVTVYMDAAKGRFNAHDWWRNDISGSGLLTKDGTGMLTLTGNNSYKGGTLLKAGTLEAVSKTAFGTGDLYVEDGTILVDVQGPLKLQGDFTMVGGTLEILMDRDKRQIKTGGIVYLGGGDLTLDFSANPVRRAACLTLITAKTIRGKFGKVTADGYNVTMQYSHDRIVAQVKAAHRCHGPAN